MLPDAGQCRICAVVKNDAVAGRSAQNPKKTSSFDPAVSESEHRPSLAGASGRRQAAPRELTFEIELGRPDRDAAGHRPEDLELEPVRILRVQGEADAVVGRADERARARSVRSPTSHAEWYMRATRSSGRETPICSNRPR